MTPFIFSDVDAGQRKAWLYQDEAKHCMKVMRKRLGEEVIGIDGSGHMYRARIAEITKKAIELILMDSEENWGEKAQQINLLVSPLHKADRFEWLVEKAVELGVTSILPYIGQHTVKTGLRVERLERIAMAALKQSLRSRLPEIHEPEPFSEVIESLEAPVKLIAHGPTGQDFHHFHSVISSAPSIDLLIGPEGDFGDAELELAHAKGFQTVGLGQNRLRSETAAIHLLGLVKSSMGY